MGKNRSEQGGSPLRIDAMVILNKKTLTFQFSPGAIIVEKVAESISGNAI
jgi:hypothetical protein